MIEEIDPADLAEWIAGRRSDSERFVLGICGPPGSGKTTCASELGADLRAPVVSMDGFHLSNATLDERGLRPWKGSPRTFDDRGFVGAVRSIRSAQRDVMVPEFDRAVDDPVPDSIRISSAEPLVIVEGNYLLLPDDPWSQLVDILDAVIYIDLDRDTRIERLIDRHVEFGKSKNVATEFVRDRDERNTKLIEANRERASAVLLGT